MLVDILRTDAFFFTSTRINTFERGVPVVTTVVVADGAQIDLDAGVTRVLRDNCLCTPMRGVVCMSRLNL